MSRFNILYMHVHDAGRYIQPYGYAIPTPKLQRLAEQGTLFRQCHCSGPTCSASRAALLTGQSAHSSGMTGLAHRGWSLNDYSQHIVHTLRRVGYRSTLVGVQHVAAEDETIGYDEVRPTPDGRAAAAEDFLSTGAEEPFFLSVGFSTTHRDYAEPEEGIEKPDYSRPPEPLLDTPRTRYDMACYKASARILDDQMGRVLDALEASEHADNTLVICTTDHGIAFPRMKCNLTDGGTGVMLIMRGPGGFEGGKVCDSLISQIDLFPTLCELLDIEEPGWLQGTSFMPVIRGEADEVNEAIFSEVSYHAAYEPQRSVRTQRYKYVRRFGERAEQVILPNCDDSPSKNVWMEAGWGDRRIDTEQLYELTFDPTETNNLVGDERASEILEQMRDRLTTWMRETDDPLLAGKVPAPAGAEVNDPDGVSPKEPPKAV